MGLQLLVGSAIILQVAQAVINPRFGHTISTKPETSCGCTTPEADMRQLMECVNEAIDQGKCSPDSVSIIDKEAMLKPGVCYRGGSVHIPYESFRNIQITKIAFGVGDSSKCGNLTEVTYGDYAPDSWSHGCERYVERGKFNLKDVKLETVTATRMALVMSHPMRVDEAGSINIVFDSCRWGGNLLAHVIDGQFVYEPVTSTTTTTTTRTSKTADTTVSTTTATHTETTATTTTRKTTKPTTNTPPLIQETTTVANPHTTTGTTGSGPTTASTTTNLPTTSITTIGSTTTGVATEPSPDSTSSTELTITNIWPGTTRQTTNATDEVASDFSTITRESSSEGGCGDGETTSAVCGDQTDAASSDSNNHDQKWRKLNFVLRGQAVLVK